MIPVVHAIVGFFRKDERGQDLSEYCLLTALVALVALAVFIHVSGGVQNLWTTANHTIATSGSVAAGGGGANGSGSHGQ